ncbi:MAG TPA: (2Fe-2S)-binding protein [Bryobacteraceae bacterium]|nr:(2Fe-2S)-binding protein [Bryobacteraceae bacterium]
MASIKFNLNGKTQTVDAPGDMPLLWVLRDVLGMTGTKFGCGMALCGACTVHLEGSAIRSCQTAIQNVAGKNVTTIEGLSADASHPVQQAWIELDVPQCGYCQSGQIMTASALLAKNSKPTDADIDEVMRGNICRCGTYQSIRKAIHLAADIKARGGRA